MATTDKLVRRVSLASIAVATVGALTGQVIAKDLNPQPEPPGSNRMLLLPGTSFRLNPQPEPPGSFRALISPGGSLMLNPQPEPPGSSKLRRSRSWQGLNPQPEPP